MSDRESKTAYWETGSGFLEPRTEGRVRGMTDDPMKNIARVVSRIAKSTIGDLFIALGGQSLGSSIVASVAFLGLFIFG